MATFGGTTKNTQPVSSFVKVEYIVPPEHIVIDYLETPLEIFTGVNDTDFVFEGKVIIFDYNNLYASVNGTLINIQTTLPDYSKSFLRKGKLIVDEIYSDVGDMYPESNAKSFDAEAIYQSIENILMTFQGERFFLPEFGGGLLSLPFELDTESTRFWVINQLMNEIRKWDDRIEVIPDKSNFVKDSEYHYTLKLAIRIKGLNDAIFETYHSLLIKGA